MELHFWQSSGGRAYVLDFIEGLNDEKAKPKIKKRLQLLRDWDYPRLFKSRYISKFKGRNPLGIHEVRIDINTQAFRIMFIIRNSVCYLLSGFIKKSQTTPVNELATAEHRARDVDESLKQKKLLL